MIIEIPANDYNALLATAAKDDIRYYLDGIYFDIEAMCAVATDGHALLRAPIIIQDDTDRIAPFILPRLATKPPAGGWARIDTDWQTVTYVTAKMIQKAVYQYAPIDGKYPDYLRVIPDPDTLQPAFKALSFNPDLISRTTAPLKINDLCVKLRATSDCGTDAIRVDIATRDDLTLVVMPKLW